MVNKYTLIDIKRLTRHLLAGALYLNLFLREVIIYYNGGRIVLVILCKLRETLSVYKILQLLFDEERTLQRSI